MYPKKEAAAACLSYTNSYCSDNRCELFVKMCVCLYIYVRESIINDWNFSVWFKHGWIIIVQWNYCNNVINWMWHDKLHQYNKSIVAITIGCLVIIF